MTNLTAICRRRAAWRRANPPSERFTRYRERGRWSGMIQRCYNPNAISYRHYGARGIEVCERWRDFENYYADIMRILGPCPPNKTLDRIDNDGPYAPGNVRWASPAEQGANRRRRSPAEASA